MPLFSIIIPLYNKENFIVKTLKSVLLQEEHDYEVLLINDGSTDDSMEVAKQFIASLKNEDQQKFHLFNQENQGVSAARNWGINMAKGTFISFLDADDYWYPYFLNTMREAIAKFPNEGVFSAAIEVQTFHKIIPSPYSIPNQELYVLTDYFLGSRKQSAIFTSCTAIKKSIIDGVGAFDILMKSGEDTDLWMRIGLHHNVLFINKILTRYVFDENSLSREKLEYTALRIFKKYQKEEETNSRLKEFLDLNRFALAIKLKICRNNRDAEELIKQIKPTSLSTKKKTLLKLPYLVLITLLYLQKIAFKFGLIKSQFN